MDSWCLSLTVNVNNIHSWEHLLWWRCAAKQKIHSNINLGIYISYDSITKLTAVNTNLVKYTEAWASNSSVSFPSSLHFSSLLLACLFSSLCILIYNFILLIEDFCRLTILTFKDNNYSLPRNLASTTKFYWLICEKSELFILSDSLALSDLLQTLT